MRNVDKHKHWRRRAVAPLGAAVFAVLVSAAGASTASDDRADAGERAGFSASADLDVVPIGHALTKRHEVRPSQVQDAASPAPPRREAGAAIVAHSAVVALANARGLVCTGALVAPNLVLTARHCLPLRAAYFGVDPTHPDVVVAVRGAATPPLSQVDIALVRLEREVRVPPLPLRRDTRGLSAATFVRLVGFGATSPDGQGGMKPRHYVDVPFSGYACATQDEHRYGCRREFEMVLPRHWGNDTCSGDSGGPVLEQVEGGFRILAVTARSVAGAVQECGDGGIYTRTDVFASWIDGVVKEGGPR